MQDWIQTQLANGFPALAGSTLSGTLVVKQELVNELLGELLKGTAAATPRSEQGADLSVVTKLVKHAAVRAEAGTLLIDFKLAV